MIGNLDFRGRVSKDATAGLFFLVVGHMSYTLEELSN